LSNVRLTKATDIALRIAMRLAALPTGPAEPEPTTRQVADAVQVPYTHAAKVVARLGALGVVEARRGRDGGLSLTAFGRRSSLGWLVRELEGVGDVVGCEDSPPCPLRGQCRLRSALHQAQAAFYAALDPYTIEELAQGPMRQVLLRLGR
jgi:Rrf2 family transcriptional regulator, nitric oxide-sensitive transcriptional repressor